MVWFAQALRMQSGVAGMLPGARAARPAAAGGGAAAGSAPPPLTPPGLAPADVARVEGRAPPAGAVTRTSFAGGAAGMFARPCSGC